MFTTAQNNPALRVVFLDVPVQPALTSSLCSDSKMLTSLHMEAVHDVCVRIVNWHVRARYSHGMPAPVLAPGISGRQYRISVTDSETFYRFGKCNEYNGYLLMNEGSLSKLLTSLLLSKNKKVRIYKTIILPVVLYGCETWSLTLSEEHRLRVIENRMLRRIFGPKRDQVTRRWRELHNEELHNLYSSPSIVRMTKSRRIRWAGHGAQMGETRNGYRILLGKPEGKRPQGRLRRTWVDNSRMDLRDTSWCWYGLDRAGSGYGNEPSGSIKCWEILE